MEGTAALRSAAPRWSLAGDQQLLDLLQEIHQRIVSSCTETNRKLDEMSRGLRDASVNLQNVNNKFLALSNTQFVESRVYDDDADVAPPVVEKEPPKPRDLVSDLDKLKQSLQILESYHEPLLIVRDSDSDTDSDDNDDRLVLKPKDLYAERPLPFIIGSQAWKNKWHAGLIQDESDSDSSTSKVEEVEQFSESEEERPVEHYMPDRTISTSTLSLQSEAPISVSPVRPSPAAVAADLARRLGGDIKIPEREPVSTQPEAVPRKLYKPQEPLATTIFPDEPPPLDEQSSDDDIFAELHKTQPKPNSNKVEDLFDFSSRPSGLEEALFGTPKVQTNQNKPPLFSEDSDSEVPETPRTVVKEQAEDNIKKPVGGISLFGTNKHAESIGAAILKRNCRKASTSGDESNTEEVQVKAVKEPEKKERDIFDDLFAKSEKLNKNKSEVKPNVKPKEMKNEAKKKDIFSDIFDDIDDIFSSDIVVAKPTAKDKTLFSDDDDLFADVSSVKKDTTKVSEKSDLFTGATQKVENIKNNEKSSLFTDKKIEKSEVKKESKVIKEIRTKSIFDSDSDDGLFTNTKDVKRTANKESNPIENEVKDDFLNDDEDEGLFGKSNTKPKIEPKIIGKTAQHSKQALFDSDDELFKDTKVNEAKSVKTSQDNSIVPSTNDKIVTTVKQSEKQTENTEIVNSVNVKRDEIKSVFETTKSTVLPTVNDNINNYTDNDMPPIESQTESMTEASHDSFDDEDTSEPIVVSKKKTEDFTDDLQNKDSKPQISDDIFNKPNDQIHNNENILKTTRIGADVEEMPEKTQTPDMFNDSDDDLFKSKPKIPKNTENVKQNVQTTESQTADLFSSPPGGNDIFTDIFDDVPPVFEKPKEPKKSKNVNALFDDDSDDEALFFKKNDVITDEVPEFSPSEERFGIFNDEPPAIDIDFTQKPSKKEEVVKTSQRTDVPPLDRADSIPPKLTQTEIISKSFEKSDDVTQDTTDNTSKEPKKIGKLKPMNININVNSLLPGASPKKKQVENTEVEQDNTASDAELHKSNKIEPKMVKSISFDDPEVLDNKLSKERAKIQVKRRPSTRRARREAVRKSAIDLTDSSLDSSNDNSTKEQKEKVVKTVYILNDDDIFGTKTDEQPAKRNLNIVDSDEELFKKPVQKTYDHGDVLTNEEKLIQPTFVNKSSFDSNEIDDFIKKESIAKDLSKDDLDAVANEEKADGESAKIIEVKSKNVTKLESKSFLDSDDDDELFRPIKKTVNTIDDNHDSDEELFRTAPKNKTNIVKEQSLFSNSDDDDLFNTKTKGKTNITSDNIKTDETSDEDLFKTKGIGTLGKVYNKTVPHNIFEDFPANVEENITEEITVKEKPVEVKETEKIVKEKAKKSILDDLSDEDDLFKSKTKLMANKDKSLFGDDDDDDDLFGTKSLKETKPEVVPTKAHKEPVVLETKEPKPAEPVFVDPLSLFGDED